MNGTLRFLYLSNLLNGIRVKIFILNRYISKSYTTSKNTIDQQYTERGQLRCQLLLVCIIKSREKRTLTPEIDLSQLIRLN